MSDVTKILVLSDTHIPRAADDLPAIVYDAIKDADIVFHAGDFIEKDTYDKLSSLKETRAVYGNMDSIKLRNILKQKEIVAVEGIKIGLIHGSGPHAKVVENVSKEFSGVDAIVFGHSHEPINKVISGVLYFNPGSATDTVYAPYRSYGMLEIENNAIKGKIIKID